MRTMILYLFKRLDSDNDQDYQIYLKSAFNNNIPTSFKFVPLFSEFEKLEQALPIHYLNDEGIKVK